MKNLINITTILFVFGLVPHVKAQQSSVELLLYKGYIANSQAHIQAAVEKATEVLQADDDTINSENKMAVFELAMTEYALLNATMATQDEETFNAHIEKTMARLEALVAFDPNWGEPLAILSSINGLRMAYSPWKGVYLGPKSSSQIEKAAKLDPSSPLVLKIQGISKLYTPEMFGGNPNDGLELLIKAVKGYEANADDLSSNWIYLDALSFLGQAYEKTGNNKAAIQTYEKALSYEPNYGWVKYSLLPNAKKNGNE